ncbi:MAG: bacterial Ig-like domain-containing protein, partial [Clostridiales bacterium]|nr:bacterial Ig-like domain-containing protein [Clostridiales bacterium]
FATVPISVAAKEITGIEIETYPDKVTYVEGEVFDDSGMVVLATYNDGSTSYLAANEYTYSTDPLTILDLYVTIYAGDVSDIVPIRVVDKEIVGISVTEYPDKVSYYAGQNFDSTGMIVEAAYNDGSTAIISDYSVSPETITLGTTEVTISKDGYSDTVKIFVSDIALKSIAVTTPPAKTSYYAGETFNSSGMVVTGYFNDGSSSEITDYSISNSILTSGTTLVYITYDGLYATTAITVLDKTITGIEIATQPTKTSYVAGQTFDSSGMVVNAVYSDGSTAEVTSYSISPSTLSVNDTNVLVTYGNYFASVAVSVAAKEIESISIIENPNKVDYVEGEVFDPSGMIVEATYNDGSTSYLTSSEYSYSASALTTSDNSVTIYAGDVSASVGITVVSKEITDIAVTEYPDKISYVAGQSFDSAGMIVTASYNDGSTAVITDYTVSPTTITSGTTEVTISKDGYSDTVKISVSDVVLNSIAVTKAPTKISYVAGESFDNSGMIVMGYYNDGSSAEITDYSVSNSTLSAGTTLVYITYDGLYATTAVTVTDKVLTGITVTSQPSKTSYVAGENFSTDGLVIIAEYNDGTTEEITNYSYSPVTLSTSDTSVMVTYGNYFVTIPVSVVAKEITSIEIETYPNKVTYVEGEIFDDSGMIVLATYNDGSTSYLAANEYSYSTDPLSTSDFYVTITAGSASDIVPIRVIDKTITSISVIEYPDKVSYIAGQSFDSTGMVVEATYNDGTTAIITDYTVSPETITADTTEVTISKDGYSDTVKISVSEVVLTSIAVTTSPSKISYYAGQSFDSSGMTVIGYYNDGSSEEITDYTISNPILTSGTSLVYVTYDNLYTTVAVSVSEKTLTGISIEQQPDTISYIAGQSFDNTGMIVLANYSDGTSEEITDYSISPSILSVTDTAVMITYNGYYATVSISVAAKEVESISIASDPSKTEYIEGETFNADGLIVEVVYNDGSIEYVTGGSSELSYSTDPLTTEDTAVTVTVGGKMADVTVSVVEKTLTGITVTESPDKIGYVVGEAVDLSGIEVVASYNDGTSAVISDYEYSPSTISAGTTEIIISKDGYSDSVSIVVSEKAVVSLDVTTQPNKISYFAGQTFDPAGMVVCITYNDGTTEEISDYSIINPVLSLDTDVVYITYGSLFTTVPVTVSEKVLTDIAVTSQPNTVSYVVGQPFNADGMVVTGYFTDGSTEEITDYEIDTDTLILGQTKVYVTYGGYYDVVNVSVVAKEVVGVEVISQPTKDDYVEGEIFNPEGLVIKVVYNDGEEEIMTYDNDSISYPTDPLTTSDISVDITVGGVSAEVEISVVNKEITDIQVTTDPDKIDYIVGQNFNPDGMTVVAYFNDGTSAEISDYSFTPETVSMNTNEITIIKDSFTDTVKIAVSERVITNIEVTTLPDKTEYTENDTFDPAGMTVTAHFNDGSEEEITDYNVDDFLLSVGMDKVYVTYENLFATVDITVNSKSIIAIEIITPPVTVEYIEGQQFDVTGMVVKAYYDDNSEAVLENYDYEPNSGLSLEDSIITVSKDGATTEQAITVIERVITGITITKNPDKTDYTEGDVFNPDGMEVTAEYNDGSTEVITDYTYPTEPLSEGDTSVTISYDNFTAEVSITLSVDNILSYISERNGDVNRDGSVSREDALILMRYLADTADFSEYAIHTGDVDGDGVLSDKDVTLINNHISGNSTLSKAAAVEADIDGDGEVSENDLNLVRKAVLNMWSLNVIYEANADANDDGEINMLDVVWILTHFKKATTIDYIYIAEQPDKTSYVEGQSFDPEGMVVKAVYLDGSEEIISDYTYSLDALEIGDTSIEIEYEGFTAEVEITVIEKRIGFDTTENSTKTTTEDNSETTTNTSDSSTETTTNNTSDSSTETTTESNSDRSTEITTEGGNSDSTTEATTEYNYGNSEGVVIVNLPNKVNYIEGEIFDPAGILIMLYWNDGSTSYINEDDVYIDDTPLSVGDIYGVIYYEYKNDTEKINVPITVIEKKAVSATVITPPDKTEYDEGESFDPSGMEVEIEYNDGSTEIIPGEDVTFDDTPLTPDDDSVTVIVDDIEVEVPIIVNETTTESTTEATTEDTETTTKKSNGGGGGGSGSSSHTTTETTTEATTESDDSDGNGDTDGANDSDNSENTDSENSDNNGNGSNGFTDVVGHWAEKYIEHLHNLGIVNGVTDSLYTPDTSTKRGDFAVVLNRLLDLENGNVTFDDVDNNSYYAQAISNCAAADIFIGYGDGTFKPEQTISRQEMFVIMAKLFASADYNFSDTDLTVLDDFTDGSAVSEWAKPYTSYLVSVGAVVGNDNELRPLDYITRAEMAVIIYNYIK